ncbi:helix-turn-helix transcriptional regulator [Nonomuraea lactucae]|uniref:helix-turn-helix transcriptional regulator n=1 Tax=Nonomuraea lactucae TaxID=2249762 RepID=UPI0013B369DA|nr:LuxR family transcriptional regulator [Nonomuraea lactucae]
MGRKRELHQLAELLSHPPAVVLLEGEAGVGKTRLLDELIGFPLLIGRCHPMRFPYGPVVEALREACPPPDLNPITGALRPLLPEVAHLLPPAPPPLSEPQVERHRLFRAVLSLLDSLRPITLVVEDVHWVDPDTRELLAFLARCLPAAVNLVLTYRAEDLSHPAAEVLAHLPPHIDHAEIALAPFDAVETALLAEQLLPDPGDLWPLTRGVPVAIEQLARMLAEGRQPGTPPALRDAVLLKLGTLPLAARKLVQAAAVLGQPATERTLAALAGVPPERIERGLAEALRRGLLVETTPGLYGLRQPLATQAVRDSIAPAARRRLQHRIDTPTQPQGTLSPREEQVVRLAADGLTNREIAENLVLSPRTVEVHVANALRKLGLTSRRQLRAT